MKIKIIGVPQQIRLSGENGYSAIKDLMKEYIIWQRAIYWVKSRSDKDKVLKRISLMVFQ